MLLSDSSIKKSDLVEPLIEEHVSPVSVDLTLAGDGLTEDHQRVEFEQLELKPGEFMLLRTNEVIKVPNGIAGIVKGKSSIARQGLMVECAGFVDPGFSGTITLEVKNLNQRRSLYLDRNQKICQVVFFKAEYSDQLYSKETGHHYQHQVETTKSALDE